jgi:glutathione S-transferase
MNIRASYPGKGMTPAVRADIERITGLWRDCRKRFSAAFDKDEGFLFGAFGAADAMYAPVVWRFHTYAVEVSDTACAYMRAMMALPAWSEWRDAARREPWVLEHDEVDWPTVLRE